MYIEREKDIDIDIDVDVHIYIYIYIRKGPKRPRRYNVSFNRNLLK